MRHYRVRRTAGVTHDLDLVEGYLVRTYRDLGESLESAAERAATRIEEALTYMRTFENHPYRGTELPEIRPGLRNLTNNRFVFYFEIEESLSEVRILAVFFGGMDHKQQILDRLPH